MRWLVVLLLMSFPAFAETVTTGNLLPEISEFQTSGSTDSLGGTGDAKSGGGTYTSSGDIPLTKDQVNRGFDINSSFTVKSHSSNAVLASCTSITQTSDCRDIASLTMSLYDSNALVKQFKHEVELDFSGLRSYSFTDIVAANTYGVLTGSYALYGIDAGWHHGGMYGPVFIDPSVSFTYQNIIEQQILAQIATVDQQVAIAPPPVDIIAVVPVALPPPPAAPAPIVVAAAPEAPPAPPAIAPIQLDLPAPAAEQQQQEAQAEATIEAQIEQAPEPTPEPAAEPEAPSSPEETTEAAPEAAPEAVQPPQPKTRQQKIKAAAQKVVAKIAPSQRYSAAAQTTMLVAMGMIAPRIKTTNALVDVVTMPTTSMRDDRSLANPMQNYTLFGSSNGAHEALVQLDWKR
jgi:hypothetical protein